MSEKNIHLAVAYYKAMGQASRKWNFHFAPKRGHYKKFGGTFDLIEEGNDNPHKKTSVMLAIVFNSQKYIGLHQYSFVLARKEKDNFGHFFFCRDVKKEDDQEEDLWKSHHEINIFRFGDIKIS